LKPARERAARLHTSEPSAMPKKSSKKKSDSKSAKRMKEIEKIQKKVGRSGKLAKKKR
jgi:hypothetical protein